MIELVSDLSRGEKYNTVKCVHKMCLVNVNYEIHTQNATTHYLRARVDNIII